MLSEKREQEGREIYGTNYIANDTIRGWRNVTIKLSPEFMIAEKLLKIRRIELSWIREWTRFKV